LWLPAPWYACRRRCKHGCEVSPPHRSRPAFDLGGRLGRARRQADGAARLGAHGAGSARGKRPPDEGVHRQVRQPRHRLSRGGRALGRRRRPRRRHGELLQLAAGLRPGRPAREPQAVPAGLGGASEAVLGAQDVPPRVHHLFRLGAQRRRLRPVLPAAAGRSGRPAHPGADGAFRQSLHRARSLGRQLRPEAQDHPQHPQRQPRRETRGDARVLGRSPRPGLLPPVRRLDARRRRRPDEPRRHLACYQRVPAHRRRALPRLGARIRGRLARPCGGQRRLGAVDCGIERRRRRGLGRQMVRRIDGLELDLRRLGHPRPRRAHRLQERGSGRPCRLGRDVARAGAAAARGAGADRAGAPLPPEIRRSRAL